MWRRNDDSLLVLREWQRHAHGNVVRQALRWFTIIGPTAVIFLVNAEAVEQVSLFGWHVGQFISSEQVLWNRFQVLGR